MTAAPQDPRERLSDHDRQLLGYLAAGYDRREIGLAMGVCPRTIQYHLERLLKRFECANSRELLGRFIPPSTFSPPVISDSSVNRRPSRKVAPWH